MSRTVVATKTLGASEQVVINKYGDGSLEFQRLLKTTGTVASGSPNITSVASTNGIAKGHPISGVGIPAGATVVSFVANTSIVMSANATANGAAEAITINKTPNLAFSRETDSGPSWQHRLVSHLLATN